MIERADAWLMVLMVSASTFYLGYEVGYGKALDWADKALNLVERLYSKRQP